ALHERVLPPTTGCRDPHPELLGERPALRVLSEPEPWPAGQPLRSAVSAMGSGGINTHVVLERPPTLALPREGGGKFPPPAAAGRVGVGGFGIQDAELFLFEAPGVEALRAKVERVLSYAPRLSRAELVDCAAQLQRMLGTEAGQVRAAVVAS